MSANPAYPGAHPTAPGGMRESALLDELVERHGWDRDEADALKWPEKIDAVCQARLDREAEAKTKKTKKKKKGGKKMKKPKKTEPVDETAALIAEMAAARAEAEAARPPPLLTIDPDSYDYTFDGHAGAGPSGAHRWMNCTASLRKTRRFLETLSPEQQRAFAKSGDPARQGTTAHAAAEGEINFAFGRITSADLNDLLTDLRAADEGTEYTDEMADDLFEYVELVKGLALERGEENILVEQRFAAAVPLPNGEIHLIRGSADAVGLPTPEHPTLVVVDLKYGFEDVDPTANPQARLYGVGALDPVLDEEGQVPEWIEDVDIYIAQPRSGGIKKWTESIDDLLDWRDDVAGPAVEAALFDTPEHPATFSPSKETCEWCPVRGDCHALAEQRIHEAASLFAAVADAEFADGHGATLGSGGLTDARLGELLAQINGLQDIRDDLKAEAHRRMMSGKEVPGFYLGAYQPPRTWKEGAEEALGDRDEMWSPRKFISPTQAVTAAGKDKEAVARLNEYIDTPDTKPVVSAIGERRKAWTPKDAESMFKPE